MGLNHKPTIQRRNSIPQELEDPEDCTIGEGQGDLFEPHSSSLPQTAEVPAPLPASPSLSSQSTATPFSLQALPRELRNLIAGGLAGMLAKSVVAPVDRIKILYQVSSAEFHLTRIPRVMLNIIQEEGMTALWKGNLATMIRVFPYSGVQFMVFDRCKRFFLCEQQQKSSLSIQSTAPSTSKHGLTAMESLVSGMIAGSISVLCTYPLDLTRAQLAVLKRHKKHTSGGQSAIPPTQSFGSVLRQNYYNGGIRGLFRGISPTLLGILPYSGIAFTLNEQGKRRIQSLTHRDLTTMERMQCGAFAGLFAQTATYPIEVTRRRMQTGSLVASSNDTAFGCLDGGRTKTPSINSPKAPKITATAGLPRQPDTMQSTVLHLYKEQGIRGFYKGVSMNWMKGPIAFSISFTTFDTVQGLMETEVERAQRLPQRFTDEEPPMTRTTTSSAKQNS